LLAVVLVAVVGSRARATLGVVSPFATSSPSFAGVHTYATGPDPISVAIGDLNNDGKPDLATANFKHGTHTVSVLLNTGDGHFGVKHDFTTGYLPQSVAIGDLNGDAKPDVVTANSFAGTVSVLLNRGDGTFQAKLDYRAGDRPNSVAIGDLNTDGKPDLAVARHVAAGTVSVLLNRGDGSFQPKLDYRTGTFAEAVAIGDLNADGKPDLAVPSLGASAVSVLLNKGDGTFPTTREYATAAEPVAVAIGDLTGDGKPDIAVANDGGDYTPTSQPAGSVSVFLNTGDGTFRRNGLYPTATVSPQSIAIGDLSGDAKADLVTANFDKSDTVSVLLNRGDDSFQAALLYPIGRPWSRSVAISDLNGDGKADLTTASLPNTVSVRLANTAVVCTVPNVVRKTQRSARRAIASAQCGVGKIRRAYSRAVGKGRVIFEDPEPRTVLPRRGKVNLFISLGA
jgi:FG-GAP-like repeat/PASTA domain/FG-GAP repeat